MVRIDDELAQVAAILVEERVLRRIIKRHRRLTNLGLQVPHVQAHGYALARAELGPLIEPGEVAIGLDRLPARVAVVTGDRAALAAGAPAAWLQAWRAVFHARVHDAIDDLVARGVLTPEVIGERFRAIGPIEVEEARLVLRQEDLLLPPGDAAATYGELAALFLELRHFAPHTLPATFSTIEDPERVEAILARDVDAVGLLAASRPGPAPPRPILDPAAVAPDRPRPAPARRGGHRAWRAAEAARARGNRVRAAILACRGDRAEEARADLDALVTRLGRALGGASSAGWVDALLPVAEAAASHGGLRYTAAARLLLDLQAACVAAERALEIVDAITWARTLGKQSIVRTLPATREIRVARRLRAAARKLPACDLARPADRERLARVIHAMVERAADNVRAALRPAIERALAEVAMHPRHLPERVAQKKIVDELLDQAVKVGHLSIGDLRDAIAHNELKLAGLRPRDLVRGDQLLRLDRLLATSLDGVYRRGEIYMRFLQKVSSVLAGNTPGRLLTLYVLLPLVGAFFIVEGLHHMVAPVADWLGYVAPPISNRLTLIAAGVTCFLLLHARWFRWLSITVLRGAWQGLTAAASRLARALGRVPLLRRLVRRVLVPAIPAAAMVLLGGGWLRWPIAGAAFVAVAALVSSLRVEEAVSDWLVRSGRHLSRRIVPGLAKYALEAFAWSLELLERGIYRVDERLRFRPNQSQVTAIVKGVLGTLWFAVSYVLRLYVNLFVEPTINPIKHFPVVTVAAKLILPLTPQMVTAIAEPASSVLGSALGASFAGFTVLVLPGLAGFLAWELNGNWKLYAHNRREHLHDVAIGSHGESLGGLLKLGFHSGTVPKQFAKLRRATWKDNPRAVERARIALHHVEEALWKFADRQLVSMLNEDLTFRADDVAVEHVDVRANRLRIALVCPSVAPGRAVVCFEEQSGWLVAGLPEAGWLDALPDDQRRTFELALIGFYRFAGIDLVREQLEAVLGDGDAVPAYDAPAPVLAGRAALFGRQPVRWEAWATSWQRLSFGIEPARLIAGPELLPPRPHRT